MTKTVFALAGNQNCGKTTLFNALTGGNAHVGNFPGVTVEKKQGRVKKMQNAVVVDLPGIYSLSPYTAEEIVARDFLICEKPNAIINIVDATSLERSLYFTLQLIELNIPLVVALNMMDEARQNGYSIDVDMLSRRLGVAVVPISAKNRTGIEKLLTAAESAAKNEIRTTKVCYSPSCVKRTIDEVAKTIEAKAKDANLPLFHAATKLIEGDETPLSLSLLEREGINAAVSKLERELGVDGAAAIADFRYSFIDEVVKLSVKKPSETQSLCRSFALDKILTHRLFALPIFFAVMLLIFWLTFGSLGHFLSSQMERLVLALTDAACELFIKVGVAPLIRSLVIDGIFAGVGSVLCFMPTVLLLFFFLSILEDTGYMARVAFFMDKPLRSIGLSGRSFVPMIIGFGCTVPAIMASRTLASERDRKMTILLLPFISCSAKLPIYAMITNLFFSENKPLVMLSLYLFGMAAGIVYGLYFKNTVFKSEPTPFLIELPSYRLPSVRSVFVNIAERGKGFIKKAFTVILLSSIVVWLLRSFDLSFSPLGDGEGSMLGALGQAVAPIFVPLGFGDWRISTALIAGLTAKEAVVSTLSVLVSAEEISLLLSPLSAVSLMTFVLLYMPCVAAMAVAKRELGSRFAAFAAMLTQTGIAWLASFVIYNAGLLLGLK